MRCARGIIALLALGIWAAPAEAAGLSVRVSGSGTVNYFTPTSGDEGVFCIGPAFEPCAIDFPYDGTHPYTVNLSAAPAPGWTFQGWDPPLEPGENPVLVMDTDRAVEAVFTNEPPKVAFSPATDELRNQYLTNLIRVAGTATDTSAIARVDLKIRNTAGDVFTFAADVPSDFDITWRSTALPDGTAVPDGEYTMYMEATDDGGSVSRTSDVPVTIDNSPPEITITGPKEIPLAAAGDTSWLYTVVDEHSGLLYVTCALDSVELQPCPGGFPGIPGTGLAAGPHSVSVTTQNNAGIAKTEVFAFTVKAPDPPPDPKPPVPPILPVPPTTPIVTTPPAPPLPDELGTKVTTTGDDKTGTASGGLLAAAAVDPTRVTFRYLYAFRASGPSTKFTSLGVRGLSRGATLAASCKGKGCPKKVKLTRRKEQLVASNLVGRALEPGTRIELVASQKGRSGLRVRITTRKGKAPRVTSSCLAPDSTKVVSCGGSA